MRAGRWQVARRSARGAIFVDRRKDSFGPAARAASGNRRLLGCGFVQDEIWRRRVNGWNPSQLVARGVFDSIEEADAILCRWDEARARSTITPDSWRRGMALDVPISRPLVKSGGSAPSFSIFAGAGRGAGETLSTSSAPCLCPWCAVERAAQGHGSAPRTGFVAVARCERHSAESPALLAPQPTTRPPSAALSHAPAAGFLNPNPNPNAGAVQAFLKGRWS